MSSNSTATHSRKSSASDSERGSISSAVKNTCGSVEQCVRDNPNSSMLTTFGIGLGIGVAAGLLFGGSRRSTQYGWFDRHTAERMGSRIAEAISNVVPESIRDRIHG